MREIQLGVPAVTDSEWRYTISNLVVPPRHGKFVVFTSERIIFRTAQFSSNRILHNDDPSLFISVNFKDFRMPDYTTVEYIHKFFRAGLWINGRQYRFYHHSNSQLRERSCYLRVANTDEELDARIYQYGDFGKIKNVAKRAKRIGLLFSSASIDYSLHPRLTQDIEDIMIGDENFSDGCGLMSRRLAVALSKTKKIMFRGVRYTPAVFQIRYLGYKGVLMLHPTLDKSNGPLAQFRKSMKKFTATIGLADRPDHTFSVVDYSKPYSFGRLNNDIIVLISSLGITNEVLLAKQAEYFSWLTKAANDLASAVDLLSSLGEYNMAERAILDGLDTPAVQTAIKSLVNREVKSFVKDTGKARSRMIVRKSRHLFGVCDPFGVLREGEVHVRISAGRQSATTLEHCDVLVIRNPCLHPGDVIKLRTVVRRELDHLVDCVVFASVGKRAAAAMTSGGDLDGDQFTVCWDPDIVPFKITDSYTYPPGKDRVNERITRQDLAGHFAAYSGASVAKVARLHDKWARYSPLGAMSSQCQELNALHSLAVDGGRIKIPLRLQEPPEATQPYIIDELAKAAAEFARGFLATAPTQTLAEDPQDARETIAHLLASEQHAFPEWQLVQKCMSLAWKHRLDFRQFLPQIDFGSLTAEQKHVLAGVLLMDPEENARMWNSLFRSDILHAKDLQDRNLDRPLRFQRYFTSRDHGRAAFFEYLFKSTRDFVRKLIVIKVDSRLAIGIFIKGVISWDEAQEQEEIVDPGVEKDGPLQIAVCSFEYQSSHVMSTYKRCPPGFRLFCRGGRLQLYNRQMINTFIYLARAAVGSEHDIVASIALQNLSPRVQKQIGRINRNPVSDIEIHVVSNRDRVGQQAFDLRFEHVQTEEVLREKREPRQYKLVSLRDMDWADMDQYREIFTARRDQLSALLGSKTSQELDRLMFFGIDHRAVEHQFWIFEYALTLDPLPESSLCVWMDAAPELSYVILKQFDPSATPANGIWRTAIASGVLRAVIRSATTYGIASLVALEKLKPVISGIDPNEYSEILYLASLCVRGADLARETLLVLNDVRSDEPRYADKQLLAVVADRAEEAFDECPLYDDGAVHRRAKGILTKLDRPADAEDLTVASADIRVDKPSTIRLHSHVRLQAASVPDGPHVQRMPLDGVVKQAMRGQVKIQLLQPLPPEFKEMDWDLYDAGSVATTRAMLDAVTKLATDGRECCELADLITEADGADPPTVPTSMPAWEDDRLNESQLAAVNSVDEPLALIWGPPGTGKTTVVLAILERFLRNFPNCKILMTASTHNAVDNVLERFARLATERNIIPEAHMIRVATDVHKVNKALHKFTIDAMLGGSPTDDPKLVKRAEERVKAARIVFSTCAGAGLGLLRKVANYDVVVIDEASQVTEPASLIPLVKGCKQAVLVGDHVQLRPMARKMSIPLQFDISLMERLYRGPERPGMQRTMLDVQYRFPAELAAFPSEEFYDGRLRTGPQTAPTLPGTFPWPHSADHQRQIGTVFVPCAGEEDFGRSSKSNKDQAALVKHIVSLVMSDPDATVSCAVLTPYSAQQKLLRAILPSNVPCSSIDGFQGREADIIIFSTVRCNTARDIGFLQDERRLNVVWTRARYALIVVGDADTLKGTNAVPIDRGDEDGGLEAQRLAHARWGRALASCAVVEVTMPDAPVTNQP